MMLYDSAGETKQKCVRIFGNKLCEEFQLGGWAKRTGPIQLIALSNGMLRAQIPLQYKLKATAHGRLIRDLLRGVEFKEAAFIAIADLRPVLNTHWQLNLIHQSHIVWQQPPTAKVLGISFDIQDQIEKPLKKALNKALAKQQTKLAEDERILKHMESFWSKLQTPRKLTEAFPLWLRTLPSALSLSEIRISQHAIELDLSLQAQLQTARNQAELSSSPVPLPLLSHSAIGPSLLQLNLPLLLDYQALAANLQQRLKEKPIKLTEANASIQVNAITIYPSNDRLVLAADITLNGFKNWFRSHGKVYISGKPLVDNQAKVLRLENARFSRQLDSPFWTLGTTLMQTQLLESLQAALVYDFSEDYQALYQSLNQHLQSPQQGTLQLRGTFDALQVQAISPDLDALRLVLEASGAVDIELSVD